MKTLVAGWFSFPGMGASAGDLLARDVVCTWLDEIGQRYDIALAPPFQGGVDWAVVDPNQYSDVVFVCGPFGNGWPIPEFLDRFRGRRLVGLNLSMLEPLETWNPFETLLERDSSRMARPDIALLAPVSRVPVIGIILVHAQREYADGLHERVHSLIREVVASIDVVAVPIDTRLDANAGGLRSAAQVESLISRMDAVITTRLHGTVLAIRNGVPPVAIDPIRGGAKIARQATVLGWPVLRGEEVTDSRLRDALDWALSDVARAKVVDCRESAQSRLSDVRRDFMSAFAVSEPRR